MFRPRPSVSGLLAVLLATLAAAGCSGGPEQPILNQFFAASRIRDNTALQNFATVTFEPRTQGTVSSFTITGVTPEQHKAVDVKSLAKVQDDAKAADAEFSKRKQEYQNNNLEAIQRVLKAERENTKLKGKDAEVQAAWAKLRDESVQASRKVSQARSKLASETAIVALSVEDSRNPVDLRKHDVDLVSKEVTVAASVKLPSGQTADRTLVITMQRAMLSGGERPITGRWIITGVKDTAAPAGTRIS